MLNKTEVSRFGSPKFFSSDLGFVNNEEFSSFIHPHFQKKKGQFCKSVCSSLWITCQRLNHFLKTGVWVNEHKIGQHLNHYRFKKKISFKRFKRIEAALNKGITPDFTQKAYTAATKETFLESLSNNFSFFCQFVKSPTTVGSLLPSSQQLAKEMARQLPGNLQSGCSRRFLEVGPGTGTFTAEIIGKLREGDQLDLVEFDKKFVKVLRKRFGHMPNVRILHEDFIQFRTERLYDHAISGLPLASFSPDNVAKIYSVFDRVIKKQGTVTYFEYMGLPSLKPICLKNRAKADFQAVLAHKENYYRQNSGTSTPVWLNLTPARVCRVTVGVNLT